MNISPGCIEMVLGTQGNITPPREHNVQDEDQTKMYS
jgi:hypothetical protein